MIVMDRVTHRYEMSGGTGIVALSEVSLTLSPRRIYSIVGPSGCGKSTLLGVVAGLIAPTAGSISRRPRRIGLVSQRPGLLNWRTLYENVRLPLELEGMEADSEARVWAALELTQLTDRANEFPSELSGGMQPRAAIARALVTQPELVLLDEPFGALDELTGQEIVAALSALLAETAPTVLMITHSLTHAAFLSDTVFVMSTRPGRIAGQIEIDVPHPRPAEFFDSDVFHHAVTAIRERLWEAK